MREFLITLRFLWQIYTVFSNSTVIAKKNLSRTTVIGFITTLVLYETIEVGLLFLLYNMYLIDIISCLFDVLHSHLTRGILISSLLVNGFFDNE